MKKLDWTAIAEITIAIIIGGAVIMALSAMFSGWFAQHGLNIHGLTPQGTPPATK